LAVNWISSCFDPSFLFSWAPSLLLHIFFNAPTCTTTTITLEPCALNAEFQHVRPRFNKLSLLCGLIGGWKQAQRQGEDRVTLMKTLIPWQFSHWNIEILQQFFFQKTNIFVEENIESSRIFVLSKWNFRNWLIIILHVHLCGCCQGGNLHYSEVQTPGVSLTHWVDSLSWQWGNQGS
jgi:hypothetical protein